MTIRNGIAYFEQCMIDIASVLDSLLLFSFLFAMLYGTFALLHFVGGPVVTKYRERVIPLLAAAALAVQYTSVGDSLVFLLMNTLALLQSMVGVQFNWPMALACRMAGRGCCATDLGRYRVLEIAERTISPPSLLRRYCSLQSMRYSRLYAPGHSPRFRTCLRQGSCAKVRRGCDGVFATHCGNRCVRSGNDTRICFRISKHKR